jgi:cysteine desulfurase
MAIGLPRDTGYGSLRFSIGKDNTKEDVDYVLETLPAVVEKLRKLSPAIKKKRTTASADQA